MTITCTPHSRYHHRHAFTLLESIIVLVAVVAFVGGVAAQHRPPAVAPTATLAHGSSQVSASLAFGVQTDGALQSASWAAYAGTDSGRTFNFGEYGPSANTGSNAVWSPRAGCSSSCYGGTSIPVVVTVQTFVTVESSSGACQVYSVSAVFEPGVFPATKAATVSADTSSLTQRANVTPVACR